MTRDHPARRAFHTFTDPTNTPMMRTNIAFGYRTVERVHEVQLSL